MPNVYGKTNNVVTKKEYIGVETDTAKVNVNNNNSTISVDVKKTPLPNELEITILGGEQPEVISYDGAHKREVTVLGQEVEQKIDTEIETFERQVNEKLDSYDSEIAKIPAIEETVGSLGNRVHNVERVNFSQGIVLGKHDKALDNLSSAVDQNVQAIGSLWGSLNADIQKAKRINLEQGTGDYIGKLKFTPYEGDPTYVQGGYLPDNDTLQLVDNYTKMALKKVYVDSDTLEGTGADSNNSLNAKAIKDENDVIITPTNVTNINLVENIVNNKNTGELIFTDYAGGNHTLRSGYLPDEETITLNNNQLEAIAIKDQVGTITPADIRQDISDINQEISAIEGTGGYLIPYDFNTATPDLPLDDLTAQPPVYSELTQYALSQITNISDPVDIWNGTRVENKYNGHTWILNNTPDTNPAIFEWVDLGVSIVSTATNSTQGIVKGSSTSLKVSVDNNGEMSVNDLSTELNNRVTTNTTQDISGVKTFTSGIKIGNGTATGDIILDSSDRVVIKYGANDKVKVGSADTLFANRVTPDSNNTYDLGRSGVYWKDLYLSGNLTDGTNSISVSNIANKGLISDEYNSALTYNPGDITIYNSQLYKCIATTTGAFDVSDWLLTNIKTLIEENTNSIQGVTPGCTIYRFEEI